MKRSRPRSAIATALVLAVLIRTARSLLNPQRFSRFATHGGANLLPYRSGRLEGWWVASLLKAVCRLAALGVLVATFSTAAAAGTFRSIRPATMCPWNRRGVA